MIELETRDPKLKGGLGNCDTSLHVVPKDSVHSGYSVRTQSALHLPLTSAIDQVWVQMARTSGTERRRQTVRSSLLVL